jgi:hypothetical protein
MFLVQNFCTATFFKPIDGTQTTSFVQRYEARPKIYNYHDKKKEKNALMTTKEDNFFLQILHNFSFERHFIIRCNYELHSVSRYTAH